MNLPGRIPVRISPFFWMTAAFIGYFNSRSLIGTLLWVVIIFISILVHEFGHAITAKAFGQKPRVELVAFGGLTYPEGPKLKLWKEFIVVVNGPLFGFSLFIIASIMLQIPYFAASRVAPFIGYVRIVNLFWTVVNLLPVLPLDGGQMMRIIFESFVGAKGMKYAIMVSMVVSFAISITFFILGGFLIGAIFFLFAFQNLNTWRSTKHITNVDQDDTLKRDMGQADEALQRNDFARAEPLLDDIRKRTGKGMTYNYATQMLARVKIKLGKSKDAYDLLMPLKKHLMPEAEILLHSAAFDVKDYKTVYELAGECFQKAPLADVAIKSAMACGSLGNVKAAIGWLRAAKKEGLLDVEALIKKPEFDPVRQDPAFRAFSPNQHS